MPVDRVLEIHGSIRFWQCSNVTCMDDVDDARKPPEIWEDALDLPIDPETQMAIGPFPLCRNCNTYVKRPNVCMFSDWGWQRSRCRKQEANYDEWLDQVRKANARVCIIEIGAGTAIASVRDEAELLARTSDRFSLIRINLEYPAIPSKIPAARCVSLQCGGLKALKLIEEEMNKNKK